MGVFAKKMSLIVKLFVKYFPSLRRVVINEAPKIWKKHWTIGELIPVELNEKEKYAILRVKGFNLHSVYCHYLAGYFAGILQMLVKLPKTNSQETKCSFKGAPYHEFLIKW